VKPESMKFIEQANIVIGRADIMLKAGVNEDAARSAYMASFHVAQADIFERTSKVSKSHNGVQTEFFRLTKDDSRVDRDLRKFLAQAYEFKSIADYFAGADTVVPPAQAADAIAQARRFIDHFSGLVAAPSDE
jgi:uncharacterized protein (UPF0332 family)